MGKINLKIKKLGVLAFVGVLTACVIVFFYPVINKIDKVYALTWSPLGDQFAVECAVYDYYRLLEELNAFQVFPDDIHRDICLIDRRTGDIERLTGQEGMRYPAWSSDGKLLAWYSGYDEAIMILDLETEKIQKFYSNSELFYIDHNNTKYISWSQDGSSLLLHGFGIKLNISTGVYKYFGDIDYRDYYSWSPNQDYLIVKKYLETDNKDESQYIIQLEKNRRVISNYVNSASYYTSFSWSRDSMFVAWTGINSLFKIDDQIMITYAPTGQTINLDIEGLNLPSLSVWSPDGDYLAFSDFGGSFYVLALEKTTSPFSVKILDLIKINDLNLGYKPNITWSTNGQYLISNDEHPFSSGLGPFEKIWVVSLAGEKWSFDDFIDLGIGLEE